MANPQKVSLDQASVYRLILTNLLVMRGETQIKEMPNDLYELFKMACGNEVNMNVTYNAMTEIYRELATEDHIIAFDDQAN